MYVRPTKPIKQKHYPLSPATEELMYDEVDRVIKLRIKLGVIEEFNSAWTRPGVSHSQYRYPKIR